MNPFALAAAVAAMLLGVAPAVAHRAPISALSLHIDTGDDPPPRSIAVNGASNGIRIEANSIEVPVSVIPDDYDQQPMSLTINWTVDNAAGLPSASLPALLLPAFGGRTLRLFTMRSDFEAADVDSADDLCFHTNPDDVPSAFRTLFTCQEWVHVLDRAHEHWTKSYLRGLRGWFDGSYFLFTRVRPVGGFGLSPWGLQGDLVAHLEDVIRAIDSNQRTAESFEPYLRIADIRQALEENDRWQLKLYALVPQLAARGEYEEAAVVNSIVMDAYHRVAAAKNTTGAIDGVDSHGLESNAAFIATRLAQSRPPSP